ncbi:MAG: DUF692 domain-containing protein [Cellvibrionaceae bacterium]|nr:DUF692 domain-containing protein [Cellvibrionaceae bacterium]
MKKPVTGVGLGFRREMLDELRQHDLSTIDFFEIAPENWLCAGGRYASSLREFTECFPFTCHGLSLSIGSVDPLDTALLHSIRHFMAEHDIALYTEHLSWCSHNGHLYDLLPIPCTDEAVMWVSQRVKQVQDILQMPIGLENASYYFSPPGSHMSEQEFISAIVRESGCYLHLDVNNIYVNSQNFSFDPIAYMKALPLEKTRYMHVAGHYVENDGLIVDTHGAAVIDPVWALLETTYDLLGDATPCPPICLERDFNFPALSELLAEIAHIRAIQGQTINQREARS